MTLPIHQYLSAKNGQLVEPTRNFSENSIDLFQQQIYLLNGIDMKLKLKRIKNEFWLFHVGNEKPRVIIEQAIHMFASAQ